MPPDAPNSPATPPIEQHFNRYPNKLTDPLERLKFAIKHNATIQTPNAPEYCHTTETVSIDNGTPPYT